MNLKKQNLNRSFRMNHLALLNNRLRLFASLFVFLIFMAACDLQSGAPLPAGSGGNSQAPIVPTAVNTPTPGVNEPIINEENSTRETVRALTVWVLPEYETDEETPAGNVISQQFSTFESNHPEVQLVIEHKSIVGQGGLFDYFSTASAVAPDILPDLILVPHRSLPELVSAGVIYPLDDLIPADELQDIFPVGDELVTVDGQRYGYPYALSGLTHAAYNTAVYSGTLPSRLDQITATNLKPAFPAAGPNGAALLFQLYLDEGGQLYNDEGELAFETTPLLVALRRIQSLRDSGSIDDSVGDIATHEEMWSRYKSGGSSLILTNHRRFKTESRGAAEIGFSQFPGSTSGLTPMVDGWAWALTTADPVRQALATELLLWMVNGPNMGDWTFASQMLPARRAAIARWPQDEYTLFLSDELERTMPEPALLDSTVGTVLQGAMLALFSTENPPVQAIAENAINAINGN
ncbi:MAG: ABC transporter substrate-binding protein [Anaerolineae bacterium]